MPQHKEPGIYHEVVSVYVYTKITFKKHKTWSQVSKNVPKHAPNKNPYKKSQASTMKLFSALGYWTLGVLRGSQNKKEPKNAISY